MAWMNVEKNVNDETGDVLLEEVFKDALECGEAKSQVRNASVVRGKPTVSGRVERFGDESKKVGHERCRAV